MERTWVYSYVLCALIFVLAEAASGHSTESEPFSNDFNELVLDSDSRESKFVCPHLFGSFPDPESCERYYICVGGIFYHARCKRFTEFDIYRRKCLPFIIAICIMRKGRTTTTPTSDITLEDDYFNCPTMFGQHPHPRDCSKYFDCTLFKATLKTCPENQLFCAVSKKCKPEWNVNCGTRQRPTSTVATDITSTFSEKTRITTLPYTDNSEDETTVLDFSTSFEKFSTVSDISFSFDKTVSTQDDSVTSTTEATTLTESETSISPTIHENLTTAETATFTAEDTSSSIVDVTLITTAEETPPTETTSSTTSEATSFETETTTVTTTTLKQTPPETDCDEDDVDCIITETGDIMKWFKCPDDVGYHVHPSSNKLFIFCANWIPTVKRCGLDLIFSEKFLTCIEPE